MDQMEEEVEDEAQQEPADQWSPFETHTLFHRTPPFPPSPFLLLEFRPREENIPKCSFEKFLFGHVSDRHTMNEARSQEIYNQTVMLVFLSDSNGASSLSVQNKDICAELLKKAKKLNKLKEKVQSSDDEKSLDWVQPADNNNACSHAGKLLTSASVDSLCKLVKEQCSVPALTCLLNAYRAACHNVSEATSVSGCVFTRGIQKSGTFCKIFMFMLHEADTTFRRLLGISSSSSRKETVLDLKNTTKWLSVRPLIKSYIRSTVFLLNQVTDSEVLAFSISSEALVIKSRGFQEECVSSAIELLMEHFAKWSYHISFPELATAPLIQLKKVFERTSVESFKRVIKRFIDQVELNIGFVQKKREEVPFSPKDQQSVESFLQLLLPSFFLYGLIHAFSSLQLKPEELKKSRMWLRNSNLSKVGVTLSQKLYLGELLRLCVFGLTTILEPFEAEFEFWPCSWNLRKKHMISTREMIHLDTVAFQPYMQIEMMEEEEE
ncbi:hypothetical protein JHK86_012227 [Glycine max]|nr:hypothetical protein JHK86_012227 [Glycine max]